MTILGIDPGTATTGFGAIRKTNGKLSVVDYGVIATSDKLVMQDRLKIIFDDLNQVIKTTKPDQLVVEKLFFATNSKTAISVGQARGVVLLVAAQNNLPIAEYTPLQVKQAITGFGQATKKQVQHMVKNILSLKTIPEPDDAADALAIAIMHSAIKKTNIYRK